MYRNKFRFTFLFLPVTETLKRDIKCCDLLPLLLHGLMNVIKINILPTFLYLFQNLPIFLTIFLFYRWTYINQQNNNNYTIIRITETLFLR